MTSYYYAKNNDYMENIENHLHNNFKNFASLKKIDVLGNNLLLKKSILELINVRVGQKLYLVSANDIRDKLLKLDEISDVSVNINYSGIIKVTIYERQPFAIWWNKNSPWLIDEEGNKILKIKDVDSYKNLVIIFGQNFNDKLKTFLDLLKPFSLYGKIKSLHYIGNRRWDVYIEDNIVIKLPENNIANSIKKSEKVLNCLKYKDKIDIIDLRLYPEKLFLRLKDKV
ncbi:MAG: cell division protein FtsQ/DivIB [Burkholderiales bacterium]|nr:cell division protein FtsQ/DivIB [Burkholderiales bacterium]